jgi:hypothetical protein
MQRTCLDAASLSLSLALWYFQHVTIVVDNLGDVGKS